MPIGRRISIETLEGKILAVDASIWLTQFLKAMRDPDSGKVRPAAHLIGFFRRLCKLRYQGIRPVFVFDGATPEIKQRELRDRRKKREQFSHEHSEDAVQRMAKRLLVHQLKKKGSKISGAQLKKKEDDGKSVIADTTTATGAYAPGFYDPEMESMASKTMDTVTTADETRSPEGPAVEDPELVEIFDDQTDYLDQATSRISNKSDWDMVLVDAETVQEASEKGTEKKGKGETKGIDIRDLAATNPNEFDAEYVASLPPTRRKDLVEEAQRKRRLQSRREFMKVAYDPEGLSKCQLRNFLKSSRLNQNIQKMAQQASKASGFADALASDRTKRIIFTTEAGIDEVADKREKKERELRKLRQNHKLSVLASSDEESDEGIVWQDENDALDNFKMHVQPRAIVDDDDIDESGSDDEYCLRDSVASSVAKLPTGPLLRPLDMTEKGRQSDDECSAGGFVKKVPENDPISSIMGSSRRKTTIVIDDSDSSYDDEQKIAARLDLKTNDKVTQGMNDEAIAQALQEAEYDSDPCDRGLLVVAAPIDPSKRQATFSNSSVPTCLSQLSDGQVSKVSQFAERPDISSNRDGDINCEPHDGGVPLTRQNTSASHQLLLASSPSELTKIETTKALESPRGSSSEDDDVEWEDGSDCDSDEHQCLLTVRGEIIPPLQGLPQSSKKETFRSNISKDSPSPDKHTGTAIAERKPSVEVIHQPTELRTNHVKRSDVSAECNECDTEKDITNKIAGFQTTEAKDDANYEDSDVDEIAYHGIEATSSSKEVSFEDYWPEKMENDVDKRSKEISAALEQAQTTAANLTNWAGRAFRRAVAQHAAENGLSTLGHDNSKVTASERSEPRVPFIVKGHGGDIEHPFPTQVRPIKEGASDSIKELRETLKEDSDVVQITKRQDYSTAWPEVLGNDGVLRTLEEYEEKWTHERNQQDRDMDTVTDEMKAEAMNLLQLFGVPYVEAPAEAEAQCVMLEALGLVDGIVTEDSDAFVFGGKRIYKNIFDDQRYVEVYDSRDAEKEMNLTRDGIVGLAMLLGGDYTEGIKGVGIVNGMEIVDAFNVSSDLKVGLEKFRQWLDGFNPFDSLNMAEADVDMTKEHIFHRKHHSARTRWIAPKYFPDPKVLAAYLNPVVDVSKEKFSWGIPDVDRLILFCNKYVGWNADETRRLLKPVVDKLEFGGSMHQTRIDSFMRYEDGIKFADVRSKRLRDVLSGVRDASGADITQEGTKKQRHAPSHDMGSSTSKHFVSQK